MTDPNPDYTKAFRERTADEKPKGLLSADGASQAEGVKALAKAVKREPWQATQWIEVYRECLYALLFEPFKAIGDHATSLRMAKSLDLPAILAECERITKATILAMAPGPTPQPTEEN